VDGMTRVPVVLVNAYLVDVGSNTGEWVLFDTGFPVLGAIAIRQAAARRYGANRPPLAIILTHGHFDHAGSASALAEQWRVPIYAHRLELPFLTGQSDYPPQDPTVGGAFGLLSRIFPNRRYDLGARIHPLPSDGSVPHLPGWRSVHTPGHTPGHVSFFRDVDGALIAGDAVTTVNQESWTTLLTMPRELRWPPIPLTTDWDLARESVQRLSHLRPWLIAAGHGLPLEGSHVAPAMEAFAQHFVRPPHGRYVQYPALADERGILLLPPPVPDPTGILMRAVAASVAIGTLVVLQRRGRPTA
jgi:glyoxylase-like metal-dependent hydrolase (beta-lactamase superfamily II)